MDWKTSRATKSELPFVSAFFERQFKGDIQYGQTEMFTWKIFENTIHEGFINLIKDGDVIAATTSITPKRLILNNRKIKAAEIGDTYTAKEYQRQGMFSILGNTSRKQAQEQNIKFIYGLPNDQALPGWLKKAHFKLVKTLNIRNLSFTFSAKSVFQRMLGGYVAEYLDPLYQAYARLYISIKKNKIRNHHRYILQTIATIPDDWDNFWKQAVLNYDFIIDRNTASQEWRYFQNPEKYSFLIVRYKNALIGYCVYRKIISDNNQDIIIADYLFIAGQEQALNLCLDYIFNKSFKSSIRSIRVWCDRNSPYYPIFNERGLGDQNEVPVIFQCDELTKEINQISKCHFTIGDSDNI